MHVRTVVFRRSEIGCLATAEARSVQRGSGAGRPTQGIRMSNLGPDPAAAVSSAIGAEGQSRFDILAGLPERVRDKVLRVARVRSLSDGQMIYQQGDIGAEMLRVVSGNVRLSLLRPDGREVVFIAFQPGDCFGASTLVDGLPLPHTATAVGQVRLQVVAGEDFAALRAGGRAFDTALLQLFCAQMRMLSDFLADASLDDTPRRLAHRLLELSQTGRRGAPEVRTSQAELGLMLGVTRQTVNRLLGRFEAQGLLRRTYGAVRLDDVPRLQRWVQDGVSERPAPIRPSR